MPAITEALDLQTLQLGVTIRAARLSRGLTLVELAKLSDLSHPFLSQLERGHARPSMSSLERIARALETSQLDLLAGAADVSRIREVQADAGVHPDRCGAIVIRSTEGTTGPYAEGEGRLLVDGTAKFQPMEFRGANASFGDYYRHAEDEFVTVVDGTILVDLGETGIHELRAGDSLYYTGGTSHRWRSGDGQPYRLFIVKQRFVPADTISPARTTVWSTESTAAHFSETNDVPVAAVLPSVLPAGAR
ncbi:XRE family transcriptional regulator [Subtercola sp. PAMC28395]|nr:XRE family transcriptional regulator [Subtercola sp. PAMC28395]